MVVMQRHIMAGKIWMILDGMGAKKYRTLLLLIIVVLVFFYPDMATKLRRPFLLVSFNYFIWLEY